MELGKTIKSGVMGGAVVGLWVAAWPALLWWVSISGVLYEGTQLPAESRELLIGTARQSWMFVQAMPYLHWLVTPWHLIAAGVGLGVLTGVAFAGFGLVLRLDEKRNARASIFWLLTFWRRQRIVYWYVAIVGLCATLSALFWIHVPERPSYFWLIPIAINLLGLLIISPLLLVRRSVIADECHATPILGGLDLTRARTWIGIVFLIASIQTIPLGVGAIFAAISAQLLVSRGRQPMKWREILRWQALGAFWIQEFYFLVGWIMLAVPVATFAAWNIFGVPMVLDVYRSHTVTVPMSLEIEIMLSEFLTKYWPVIYLVLLPAYWLVTGRLAWLLVRENREEPAQTLLVSGTPSIQPKLL